MVTPAPVETVHAAGAPTWSSPHWVGTWSQKRSLLGTAAPAGATATVAQAAAAATAADTHLPPTATPASSQPSASSSATTSSRCWSQSAYRGSESSQIRRQVPVGAGGQEGTQHNQQSARHPLDAGRQPAQMDG